MKMKTLLWILAGTALVATVVATKRVTSVREWRVEAPEGVPVLVRATTDHATNLCAPEGADPSTWLVN